MLISVSFHVGLRGSELAEALGGVGEMKHHSIKMMFDDEAEEGGV